jgi:hypothetical protein
MIRSTLIVIVAGMFVACQPSSPDVASAQEGTKIPACSWPGSADTFDAPSNTGCYPQSMSQICEVPEGSVVHDDGTVTTPAGATVTCHDACSPTEYSLSCRGAAPDWQPPAPSPSLGCRVLPLPTPLGETIYCCPCTQ